MDSNDSTREIETLEGLKPYKDLLPQLALGVERVMKQIAGGKPESLQFSYDSILALHENAFKPVVAWAGRIRTRDVQVGLHLPPRHHQVRDLLAQFAGDVEYRVAQLDVNALDLDTLQQLFAFCEGRFTHIHPFIDFNGRVSRMLSWMLVVRLGLPHTLEIVPPEGKPGRRRSLFEALHAYDNKNPGPLEAIWRHRLITAISHPA